MGFEVGPFDLLNEREKQEETRYPATCLTCLSRGFGYRKRGSTFVCGVPFGGFFGEAQGGGLSDVSFIFQENKAASFVWDRVSLCPQMVGFRL